MSKLKVITYKDIKDLDPCYDPIKYIPKDWKGTALDILNLKDVPNKDKLWCIYKANLISDKTSRLFAIWCSREALKLLDNPHPALVKALDEFGIVSSHAESAAYASYDDLWYAAYPSYTAASYAAAYATSAAYPPYAAASYAAAYNYVCDEQTHKLIEMIKEEENNV